MLPSAADFHSGQEIFYRYGGANLTGLAYQSLLGGMGANRVVEVLARTGGFSVKVARHRLFETTQHILECTKSLESIQPGGAGFASSVRVRLLHAAVRQRIMKLEHSRPGYYNVEKYGVPINDLDCIATIGTFSATIIWLSLPRQGLFLRKQEIEDYIALWRLIAYYTGTPTEPFENPEKAKAIMESLLMNEIDPTETSKVLAGNIIKCLEAQPPAYASRSFLEVNARWLNGNELCDALGLGRPSLYYWALMAGQCLFFMTLCYFYRSFRSLDRRKIAVSNPNLLPFYQVHGLTSLTGATQDLLDSNC
jgi:ER-bound oxygenase mpaB/B'/Rubber oxygenase, catalytic domain